MGPLKAVLGQAIAFRLRANELHRRLPAGRFAEAARFALQDTVPRSGLLSLHARVADVAPSDWEHPSLVQLWSPRSAVHVVPAVDVAVFTLGRWPRDPAAAAEIESTARWVSETLGGRVMRKTELGRALGDHPAHPALFDATITGRFVIRWDARDTVVREVPAPDADVESSRRELLRRHLRAYGPSTPEAFAWWAGLEAPEARATWQELTPELEAVELDGCPAAILAEDADALADAKAVAGVRFLPMEELKMFGQDRTGLFVGPSRKRESSPFDSFHPHGLLVDGRLAGAWGRRGGRVEVRPFEDLSRETLEAVEAEARSFPIRGAEAAFL